MHGIEFHFATEETDPTVYNQLRDLVAKFGFSNSSYGIFSLPNSRVYAATTLPQEWVQIYMENDFFLHDPAIHVALQANKPIDWRVLREFDNVGFFPLYADMGLGNQGFTIPLRGPYGEVAIFSFSKECTNDEWDAHLDHVRDHLTEAVIEFHKQCLEIWDIETLFAVDPLDERQVQILQSFAAGQTIRDIAGALSISNRTVENQVSTIRRKLRAKTTNQAIAKATAMRLIFPA